MQFEKGMKPGSWVAYHKGCTLRIRKDIHNRWNAEQVYAGNIVAIATSANVKESREKYIERMFKTGTFNHEKTNVFK